MDIFKKTALYILVSTSFIACGGGGGDDSAANNSGTTGTTYKIESGAFQKGPFVAGTTVTIQELGDDLKPLTSKVVMLKYSRMAFILTN